MSKPLMRMSSHASSGMPKAGFHLVTLYGRPTMTVSESLRPSSGTVATRRVSGTLSALRGVPESPCGSSPAQLSGRPTSPPVTGSAVTLRPRCRLVGELEFIDRLEVVSCRTRPCPTVTVASASALDAPLALLSRMSLRRFCSCLTSPNGVHPSMPARPRGALRCGGPGLGRGCCRTFPRPEDHRSVLRPPLEVLPLDRDGALIIEVQHGEPYLGLPLHLRGCHLHRSE